MHLVSSARRRAVGSVAATATLLLLVFLVLPSVADPAAGNPGGSAFELDGNANSANSGGTDCDDVYAAWQAGSTTSSPSFVSETSRSASIFTGGGSKDIYDISSWQWKNGGGLPDKDNLLDAFAGRYGDVLVFGSDRYDNSGDAMQGFWFLQDEVGLGSGGSFTGAHQPGDLLILSDFNIGGTVSIIGVYEWVASGGDISPNLDSLFESNAANCLTGSQSGDVCGVVNPSGTSGNSTGGWPFTDKSGNSTYLQGEFFEGGLDLSAFGLQNQCFASFASETRSSSSPTATLKDVVIGGFQKCDSTTTTAQLWTPNDTATVSVPRATTWAGTVTFTLYASEDCTGTSLFTQTKNVSDSAPTVSTTNAGGSSGYTVTDSGTYSWKTVFTPTTNGVNPSDHCEVTDLTITN